MIQAIHNSEEYYDICRQEENPRKSDGLGQAIADNNRNVVVHLFLDRT